jgi:sulfite reductase (NADPH) flavoprotein alpha-component
MLTPMIPDNAPFSPEQRTWLNGFFAGLLSLDGPPAPGLVTSPFTTVPPEAASSAVAIEPLADGEDDEVPWHDPTIPLADRMKLAEGRPLRLRLMAAMAQQDCGQCGYNCRDYADAVFLGTEKRLNLCVPGGKQTQRMLKTLYAEMDGGAVARPAKSKPVAASVPSPATPSPPGPALGHCREKPVPIAFLGATLLNKRGSEKETRHIEFDIGDNGLDYRVGDSLGVFASNPPQLVDAVVAALDAPADAEVGDGNGHSRGLRRALLDERALGTAADALFELMADLTDDTDVEAKLRVLAEGGDPDGDLDSLDVLAVLEKFPSLKPSPKAFAEALDPLQPRLYSIASSPKAMPRRLHLTVDTVRYRVAGRQRLGVASTFLADRMRPGDTVSAYVQRSHGFGLPADPATPLVMVGPGTGVAPFRAFLHERRALGATGKAWLFFGHQRRSSDFFYEDEFAAMLKTGTLTRLSLAFSRDQSEKIYVQDRMREDGGELFRWLEEGAHVFVCGDATRMAPDVERALVGIVARHGGKSETDAKVYVAALGKTGRYRKDVY